MAFLMFCETLNFWNLRILEEKREIAVHGSARTGEAVRGDNQAILKKRIKIRL